MRAPASPSWLSPWWSPTGARAPRRKWSGSASPRSRNCAPIAIGLAKGYFTAEGLDAKLTIFEAQAPIAVAVASGDLDVGLAAQTAALYNLGEAGRVRVIASGVAEAPSFH